MDRIDWKQIPRILLAAPSSGSGKTVITCGLLEAMKRRGLAPAAFKCGPDYIDPMFHREILGVESGNLDGFFQNRELMRESFLWGCREARIAVIEGVMGYFDGLGGVTSRASSWETAKWLECPVLLVADGRGASLSIAAAVQGFLEFLPEDPAKEAELEGQQTEDGKRFAEPLKEESSRQRPGNGICGILLNRVSPGMYPMLKEMLEKRFSVPVVGYVPKLDWLHLESRHLGLKLPGEIADLKDQVERFAQKLEETVDMELLLTIAGLASNQAAAGRGADADGKAAAGRAADTDEAAAGRAAGEAEAAADRAAGEAGKAAAGGGARTEKTKEGDTEAEEDGTWQTDQASGILCRMRLPDRCREVTVGVARDEAFCFYYRDNLRLLQQAGARLEFFSPIHHSSLPKGVSGLLLGGGYPELYARQLGENTHMRREIRQAAEDGMPILGECGGFLYLQEWLEDETGAVHPMAGALSGSGFGTGKLGRFGYVTLWAKEDGIYVRKGEQIRAHEFHYWDSDCCGSSMEAQKPIGSRKWLCMRQEGRILAGFPHLYYPSFPELPRRFMGQCREY